MLHELQPVQQRKSTLKTPVLLRPLYNVAESLSFITGKKVKKKIATKIMLIIVN